MLAGGVVIALLIVLTIDSSLSWLDKMLGGSFIEMLATSDSAFAIEYLHFSWDTGAGCIDSCTCDAVRVPKIFPSL